MVCAGAHSKHTNTHFENIEVMLGEEAGMVAMHCGVPQTHTEYAKREF